MDCDSLFIDKNKGFLITTSLIDSHCHLQSIDLNEFGQNIDTVLDLAAKNNVQRMLCVCIELKDLPKLHQLADQYPNIYTSVGVHPNCISEKAPDFKTIVNFSTHRSCVAIGETGLDYYRGETDEEKMWQKLRFCDHIQAAIYTSKPLIIHTRAAADDTLDIMKQEKADAVGGVMHCFVETWDVAKCALDLGFYISFSGIASFKNATQLHEIVKKVPIDRLLIETDSPYLAPVPFRGKQNHPALVKHVAEAVCALRQMDYQELCKKTSDNFYRCFKIHP